MYYASSMRVLASKGVSGRRRVGPGVGRAVVVVALVGAVSFGSTGCGDDSGETEDAGPEDAGGVDAGVDGGVDGGPTCESECLGVEVCCPEEPGSDVGVCIDTRNDLDHCGACGDACGPLFTQCAEGRCFCGATACIEPRVCCPGRTDPDERACRSVNSDPDHCGDCNDPCDEAVANLCVDGECVCGAEGRACDPDEGETCCRDGDLAGGARCAKLAEDDDFCGACEKMSDAHRCSSDARCIDGLCTVGSDVCEGGCAFESFICCRGECCLDARCGVEGCL